MPVRADDSVGLLTWAGDPDRVIQDVEWKLEDRQDSTNRLEVTTSLAEAEGIQTEQELIFQNRRFIVDEVDRARAGDTALIVADEAQAELSGFMIDEFDINAWTLEDALSRALEGTRWSMGDVVGTRYGRAQFEDISVLDVVKFLARHQDARVTFDSLRRRVNVTPEPGTVHDTVFTYGRQLTNIEKSEQAPTLTRLYGEGADEMTVASINDGLDYVEDYSYYTAQGIALEDARVNYRKEVYWSDSRYTVQANLLRDMQERVKDESHPKITYTLTAATTHAIGADGETVAEVDDFGISDLVLMDQVHVWDQETDTRIRAEVSAITTSSDASVNEVTLSYLPESLGASVEGRYFGDSGSPSRPGGSNWYQSPPQPRPSMPILESINELGVGTFRWNGQDENGSYETIPDPFGRVQLVGAVAVDGVVPSPESEDAFMGQWIELRGGGKATIAFGAPGQFAVWFYMVGHDARTRGPYSEPLVVEVEALVDTEAIQQQLYEAQERIDKAQDDLDAAMVRVEDLAEQWDETDFPQLKADLEQAQQAVADAQQRLDTAEQEVAGVLDALEAAEGRLDTAEQEVADSAQKITDAEARLDATEQAVTDSQSNIDQLRDVTLPDLEESLTNAVTAAEDAIQAFQQEWDANWDPEAMDELRDRQETLEGDLITGLDSVYTQAQQLATAAENSAVGRAASDAQSEYDRLQELAERALSRAGDNVLEDPSFETAYWPDEWDGQGGRVVRTTTNPTRTGPRSLVIEGGSDTSFTLGEFNVDPGQSYRLQVWQRTWSSNLADLPDGSRLQILNTDTGDVLAESDEFIQTNTYTRATVILTVEDGIASLAPVIRAHHDSGLLILDDASFQEVGAAAEALRLAEVARQQAEAAHITAGNARDMAVTAQDTAAGKADIIRSTTAPTGTAPEGSIWFRYNNMTANRRLIGWWVRESGAWRSQEMDETILPQVNIGTGTYGDLSGDRLEAHTVRTNHLLVGPRNIITDPEFETLDNDDFRSWRDTSGTFYLQNVSWSNRPFARLSQADSESSTSRSLTYGGNDPGNSVIPCEAGDVFKVRFQVLMYAGDGNQNDDNWQAQIRWATPDGTGISFTTHQFQGALSRVWEEFEAEAPEGATRLYLRFRKLGQSNRARGVGNVTLEKMTDSSLIVRGAVKAEHADFQSFTADQGFIDQLDTELLRARLLEADTARITGDALVDGTLSASKLAILPDTADFAPDPSEFPELWDLQNATLITNTAAGNPSGVRFSFSRGSGVTQIRGPLRPVVQGQRIYFKGRYGYNGPLPEANISVRMEFYDNPVQTIANRLSFSTFITVTPSSSAYDVEGSVVVPEGASYANLYFHQVSQDGGNAAIQGTIHCEPQVSGVLIENGAITANHIVAESVAGAVAQFITLEAENVIATLLQASNAEFQDVVSRVATLIELNASRITAGTISTARLNVSDLAAQIANIIELNASRITAGTISASRLDISDLAARVATVISLNASRITTGQLSAARIDIDSLFANSAFISNLAAEVVEAIQLTTQRIITGDIIATGTIDTEHLNVTGSMVAEFAQFLTVEAGHIAANAIDGMTISGGLLEGGEVRGGLIYGTQITNGNGFSVDRFGSMEATGAQVDGAITARTGWVAGPFMVGNPNSTGGEGGIIPAQNNTRIRYIGRTPDTAQANDMVAYGRTGVLWVNGENSRTIVTNYSSPPPTGARVPIVQTHLHNTMPSNRSPLDWSTRSRVASNFTTRIYNSAPSGTQTEFRLYWIAYWGDPPNSPSTGS